MDEEEAEKKSYEARNAIAWRNINGCEEEEARYRAKEARNRSLAEEYGRLAAREKSSLERRESLFIRNRNEERNAAEKLADEEATAKSKREDEEDTALENLNPR